MFIHSIISEYDIFSDGKMPQSLLPVGNMSSEYPYGNAFFSANDDDSLPQIIENPLKR